MTDPLQYPPASHLDGSLIGSAMLRLVLISATLGHQHASDTARDYLTTITVSDSPEMRFVLDVFTLSTTEVCDRWTDGTTNASMAASRLRSTEPLI